MKAWILILISLLSTSTSWPQKSLRPAKVMKEIKKINRVHDPQKAIDDIEELIPQISSAQWRMKNFKTYLLLRQSDLYVRIGDYQKAETRLTEMVSELSSQDLNWVRAMLPFFEGTVFDSYDRLGYLYLTTGNLKKAEQIFLDSKAKREQVFPKRSVHRIPPLVGLGSLYFRRNELDKTYEAFNSAERQLARATSTMYDYDNISRLYLSDQVEICLQQGRSEEAWDYINKLSLASSGVAKFGNRIGSRLEIARIFELKARYYLLQGDFDKAQDYLNQANHFYSAKIASSDIKFKLLKTQALVYWFRGETDKSNQAFVELTRAYRNHIDVNFISMSEYEKEQFYNTLKNDFNLFNAYALQQQDANPSPLFEEMLNNTLNTKALLLNESNKIKNGILQGGDAVLISKLKEWEEAKAQLSSFYFDKNAISRIDSLEKRVEQLEKEINSQSSLFTSKDNPVDWKQVQATLQKQEAAIEIVRINTVKKGDKMLYGKNSGLTESAVYLALITKPGLATPEYVLFQDGNQLETRYLSFYRNTIMARGEDKASYDVFWRPLRQHLQGIKKVYFSPDGAFNQLNLNTLMNPVTGDYLIDELELVCVTNTADLLRKEDHGQQTPNAVLVGRPSYDFNASVTNILPETYGTRYVMTEELASFREQEFADLPGTEEEINRIEKTLTARDIAVTKLKGDQAREENVKSVNSPGILHIATHGFFVDDAASAVNPMIRSGLVLAGVKNQDQQQNVDGILTAYEATNLNLGKTSLVVLSACDTGLGEIRNGEGVYGLQRAIIVAGANNLLMSLWKVDDEATASLMSELYRTWQQGHNQEAFRTAQLAMRKKYPEPYYWGAFIMLGK